MLKAYVYDLAEKMGIRLTGIALVEGKRLGCTDVHLLKLSTKEHTVESLIYQTDLEMLKNGVECNRLDVRTKMALSEFKIMTP